MPVYCDETRRTDLTELCHGWLPAGYAWHGCTLDREHGGIGRVVHKCRCGHQWTTHQRKVTP